MESLSKSGGIQFTGVTGLLGYSEYVLSWYFKTVRFERMYVREGCLTPRGFTVYNEVMI